MILDGSKSQTTRKPRKDPIKAGDVLYSYFHLRMKSGTCLNCINMKCENYNPPQKHLAKTRCPEWFNYFGEADVIQVQHLEGYNTFAHWSREALEAWAKADGFASFREADLWFSRHYGENWDYEPWDIIHFKGRWTPGNKEKKRYRESKIKRRVYKWFPSQH